MNVAALHRIALARNPAADLQRDVIVVKSGDTFTLKKWAAALGSPPTDAEIAASAAVPCAKVWTVGQFRALFTDAELLAFISAATSNPAVDLMRLKLTTADDLRSDNADLLAAMTVLVALGVLTPERRAAILA